MKRIIKYFKNKLKHRKNKYLVICEDCEFREVAPQYQNQLYYGRKNVCNSCRDIYSSQM